jgi:hypothetical protein
MKLNIVRTGTGMTGPPKNINVSLTVYSPQLTIRPRKEVLVSIPPSTGRAGATFDIVNMGAGLFVNGSDAWFWDFEIMSSNPNRYSSMTGSAFPIDRVQGISASGTGGSGARNKFINTAVRRTIGPTTW